ncbi:zinc finger BED domain-containing protein RICESLEEPER 2-like [Prunus yedoensis var. nudiflora]|uniref:Zinc finger BED domain-containing protein RICESLEEPER 2-like n=1 Tax=Prunus yedoensis var. nudiflora TaxID=2094558 RepID=A0A314UFQ8_PRUYE|nr:zinc finger BED domain-containing protein RICESLEEPER 2-like [Prunus yedoensis var. nudiflora]
MYKSELENTKYEGSSQTPTINTSLTNPNESLSPIRITATTEPLVQGGTSTLPPIPKKKVPVRKALEVWKHFTKDTVEPGSDIGHRTSCNYCHQYYACDPGGLVSYTYSKERSRLACVKMIIIDDLPFRHVEGIGFNFFVKELQPRFDPPSRRTIARDGWSLFQEEKAKLKSVISQNSQRVLLPRILELHYKM